ncbi:S41 family peptidase [Jeotgalicoccus sp. WY2]|uniref:S41 family peptidase n=1 Tax=Jeotgalicoccus sp. WY2 TaxID=2708346 RepID=UPI001BD22E22
MYAFKENLNSIIDFFKENSGKGFISFENGGEFEVEGSEYPKNIIVLADVYCGSAGDIFVDIASRSYKVTVIGRPTAGLNDYSNLINKDWNEKFSLYYPTSRMVSLDNGIKDTGVKPDTCVKWTPEHLQTDIDMNTALNLIKEQ